MVRALGSHQTGPGSIPRVDSIFGLSLLLVLVLTSRFFLRVLWFSPSTKTNPSKVQFGPEPADTFETSYWNSLGSVSKRYVTLRGVNSSTFSLTLHIKVRCSCDSETQTIVCHTPVLSRIMSTSSKAQRFSNAQGLFIAKPCYVWCRNTTGGTPKCDYFSFSHYLVCWFSYKAWSDYRQIT